MADTTAGTVAVNSNASALHSSGNSSLGLAIQAAIASAGADDTTETAMFGQTGALATVLLPGAPVRAKLHARIDVNELAPSQSRHLVNSPGFEKI